MTREARGITPFPSTDSRSPSPVPLSLRGVGTGRPRHLKGTKPADLPVQQPTVFDLIVKLKTARAMGLTVPGAILTQATIVVE
jgi:putative ABC transport system substrate-binding protein